jgi:hypothetical protein
MIERDDIPGHEFEVIVRCGVYDPDSGQNWRQNRVFDFIWEETPFDIISILPIVVVVIVGAVGAFILIIRRRR